MVASMYLSPENWLWQHHGYHETQQHVILIWKVLIHLTIYEDFHWFTIIIFNSIFQTNHFLVNTIMK